MDVTPAGTRRLLIVVTSASSLGFLSPIVRSLVRGGFEVHVACGPSQEQLTTTDHELHTIPLDRSANPMAIFRAWRQLADLVRQLNIDVIVSATPVASLLGVLVGRLSRVPLVVYLCWGLRSESLRGPLKLVVSAAEDFTARLAHITIANSPSLRDKVRAGRDSLEDRVICIGKGSSHGVNLQRFSFAPTGESHTPVRIGFVGRIRRDKGVDELLRATERMAARGLQFELHLTGTLEDVALETALAQHPIARLNAPTRDIPGVMRDLDILCLPSWREGFPNVVLEASATGRPVVTTDATGARDSVVDGSTGIIVPVRDIDALDLALSELIKEPERRTKMGRVGRLWVEEHFEQTQVCEALNSRIVSELEQRMPRTEGR